MLIEDPAQTLVWLGAGASIDAPTGLPDGETLTWRALQHFCSAEVIDRITNMHRRFGMMRGDTVLPPRLEVVLGAAISVAPEAVFELLRAVVEAKPNLIHRVAAAVLDAGGAVVTTNFDECVEKACADPSAASKVVHIHQALRQRTDLEVLGAYFSEIEHGLPPVMAAQLDASLSRVQKIVVAGYSASDYFDVRPYLASLTSRGVDLSGTTVVWIAHDENRPPELDRYAAWFTRAGATFEVIGGNTADLLGAVRPSLDITSPSVTHGTATTAATAPTPTPTPLDPDTKAEIGYRLLSSMGDTAGRAQLIASGLVDPSEHERASIAWSQGRYSESLRWNRRAPVMSDADRLRRTERTGACLWAAGRLVPAFAVLWAKRDFAQACMRSDDIVAVEAACNWVDTITRTLEHMDRVELRVLPKSSARKVLREMTPADPNQLSFHARVRFEEVQTFLDAGSGSDASHAVTTDVRDAMGQAASLAGVVNYRHRELRDRAGTPKPPTADEYRELKELGEELGAWGDAARVLFIPGAAQAFTIGDAVRTSFPRLAGRPGPHFGYWQRVRTVGRFSIDRMRYRRWVR